MCMIPGKEILFSVECCHVSGQSSTKVDVVCILLVCQAMAGTSAGMMR